MQTAIISDIHIGNNKNNPLFHDITIAYAEWLKSNLKEKGIENIIICGDIFHDRVSVNLTSLECAFRFFDILEDFNIKIITGNHDCFYLNNSTVHSLSLFKKWKNVTVYDKPTLDGDFFFAPWGTMLDEMLPAKFLIAHLEMNGYEMSKNKICSNGINAVDLMEKYHVCFTGHFHKAQGRKYDKKLLLYTGSCFQLNWGESGEEKYYYTLDTSNYKLQKFKNTISPRFEYIRSEKDFDKVPNNFVSIQISDDEENEKFRIALEQYKPLDVKTQLIEQDVKRTPTEITEFKVIDIGEIIKEVVNSYGLSEEDTSEIIKMLEELHKECS